MDAHTEKKKRGRPRLSPGDIGKKLPHTPEGYFLAFGKAGDVMYTELIPSSITSRVSQITNPPTIATEVVLVISGYRDITNAPVCKRITKITILKGKS